MAGPVGRTLTYKIGSHNEDVSAAGSVTDIYALISEELEPTLEYDNAKFIQTEELTEVGIAVHPYGAIIIPLSYNGDDVASDVTGDEKIVVEKNGVQYAATVGTIQEADVGDEITFNEVIV